MAFKSLSELDDYKLSDSDQDCRGWDVVNASGTQIGKVREMLVDTERERVTALELDSGAQIPASEISLSDGRVVASGSGIAGAGATTTTTPATVTGVARNSVVDGVLVMPVVEEEIQIGKREVDRIGARVSTRVEETPVEKSVTLRDEQVNIERRPVDRPVRDGEIADFKDVTMEVHARSEEAVVSKQARVVEEVVISKSATQREETVRDTVQRTDVDVDQVSADRDPTRRRT